LNPKRYTFSLNILPHCHGFGLLPLIVNCLCSGTGDFFVQMSVIYIVCFSHLFNLRIAGLFGASSFQLRHRLCFAAFLGREHEGRGGYPLLDFCTPYCWISVPPTIGLLYLLMWKCYPALIVFMLLLMHIWLIL
jgi:hypothetical protein